MPEPTVRERMEALGWFLVIDEDTCLTEWMKGRPSDHPNTVRVIAYAASDRQEWANDLEQCQLAFGYHNGESAYA